jgi:glycosyltransferase involved in cell wall biosynthesis
MKKILIAYTNGNAYGGSELFHYELIQGLSQYADLDITVATLTKPNLDFHLWQDLKKLGVDITSLEELIHNPKKIDLILVSQPQPTSILCNYHYNNTPKISIIHSALRSEDAIKHESIKHYIAVQPDIYRCLKNQYGIKTKDISLLYNPFDTDRFQKSLFKSMTNVNGVLVGEINDPLRRPMIEHAVQNCINENMELTIISRSKYDFNNPLIKVVDQCYNTEEYLKNADFTVGIGGRQMIEGWLCGIPGYCYKVDPQGRILKVNLLYPPKIRRFEKNFVCSQYYNLIQKYA